MCQAECAILSGFGHARELESLERAKVYSHTALRIQLPDRTIVLAKFHPRETVGDVRRLLVDEVFSPVS